MDHTNCFHRLFAGCFTRRQQRNVRDVLGMYSSQNIVEMGIDFRVQSASSKEKPSVCDQQIYAVFDARFVCVQVILSTSSFARATRVFANPKYVSTRGFLTLVGFKNLMLVDSNADFTKFRRLYLLCLSGFRDMFKPTLNHFKPPHRKPIQQQGVANYSTIL